MTRNEYIEANLTLNLLNQIIDAHGKLVSLSQQQTDNKFALTLRFSDGTTGEYVEEFDDTTESVITTYTLNALAWLIAITALSIINYLHDKRLAELKERVETLEKFAATNIIGTQTMWHRLEAQTKRTNELANQINATTGNPTDS